MKNLAIAFMIVFYFLIFPLVVQSQTSAQFPPEIEKFHQATKNIVAQTPHSPTFGASLGFDQLTHHFILFGYCFSKDNELFAKEIASLAVGDITLANYPEKVESFALRIRTFFQDRRAAQRRGELKPLDSFITLTPTENNFWGLFAGFIDNQQTLKEELGQVNDKFIEVRIYPGLSQGRRVFHFYVGVYESRGVPKQLHYYPVAEFPISQITSTRNPAQELSVDLARAFEAAKNRLRQLP